MPSIPHILALAASATEAAAMSDVPDATAPHSVFVSHAHSDNKLADRYVKALRKRGLDIWYDRTNMQDGHFLSEEIERELEQRTAFVVLLTPSSQASYYVKLETDAYRALAAQDRTRLFLPVRVAECKVPTLMTGLKYIDAVALGFGGAIDALAKALQAPKPAREPRLASTVRAPATVRIADPGEVGQATFPTKSNEAVVAPTRIPTPRKRVEELLAQGTALIAQSRFAEAIPFLERVVQLNPRSFVAWANLGLAYNETGRYGDDLAAYDQALALDDTQGRLWFYKGNALRDLGRYDEALASYDRSLDVDLKSAGAWNNNGYVLYNLARYAEALDAFEHVLALEPKNAMAWYNKGNALTGLTRWAEALGAYDRSLDLDPKYAAAWSNKGSALFNLGEHEKALTIYERALDLDPTLVDAWINMGVALRELGRTDEADAAFKQAAELGRQQ